VAKQLNLFEPERATPEHRPSNPAFVRKHLMHELNKARAAERLPWSQAEAETWAERFPRLAKTLPPEEGDALALAFAADLNA